MRISSCYLIATLLAACVDSTRRPAGDTADTSAPDTSAPDTATPGDTASPEDTTTPDAAGPDDAAGDAGCSGAEQCPAPSLEQPCLRATCDGGVCGLVQAEDNTPCDDGNACSAPDTCQQGACEGGPAVSCAEPSVCMQITADPPTCDATTGCPWAPRTSGFPCGDTTLAVCDSGWSIPASICDGQGGCRDFSLDVPPGPHPLAGDWYFVATSSGLSGELVTMRALLNLGTTLGTWTATNVAASSPDLADRLITNPADGGTPGTFCAGFAGDITLEHEDLAWIGSVDSSKNIMVLSGLSQSDLGVAVRKSGVSTGLTGKFTWFGLEKGEAGQGQTSFLTRQGLLQLEGGCVQPGSQVRRGEGLGATLLFDTDNIPCFQSDNGLLRLDINYEMQDGDGTLIPMQLRGVPGLNGDIMLLTRDDGSLHYGTIVLVREQSQPATDLLGRWRFHTLRGGIATPGQLELEPRLDDGWLELGTDNALHGELFGSDLIANISGSWVGQDQPSRYSHRASFGNDLVHHTGFVAKRATFAVAMGTIAPADRVSQNLLPMVIGEGGLFLMVKPASFVEGWQDGEGPPLP